MLAAMFCSSSAEFENIGVTHCCDRGMGWLNWVSLTCLLAVKGIATGLIASIFYNNCCLFSHRFSVHFSAGFQQFIVLRVQIPPVIEVWDSFNSSTLCNKGLGVQMN